MRETRVQILGGRTFFGYLYIWWQRVNCDFSFIKSQDGGASLRDELLYVQGVLLHDFYVHGIGGTLPSPISREPGTAHEFTKSRDQSLGPTSHAATATKSSLQATSTITVTTTTTITTVITGFMPVCSATAFAPNAASSLQ